MRDLACIRHVQDLRTAASLPKSAIGWFENALEPGDVHVRTTRKKRGGFRVVCQPIDDELLRLQKKLKEFIDRKVLSPHPSVHGFTRRRSTISNAESHLGARAVLTVDIANFFPSINAKQIKVALGAHGANEEIAAAIINVSTYKGVLATGFSTSPVLSNLVFRPLDVEFQSFATASGLVYTRYADDLTFSGDCVADMHLESISDLLSTYDFHINSKKVRFQRRGHRQVVTGFGVAHTDHVRLPKHQKKFLRQDIYFAKKSGLAAQARFRDLDEADFRNQLLGRINYFGAAEPALAGRMLKELDEVL